MRYSTPVLPQMPSLWVRVLQLWAKEPFFKVCWSRSLSMQHRKVYSVTHNESDHSDDFFIGMIQCTTTNTPDWKVSILINHQRISFKIDTGAQCNVISKSRYHQLGSMPLQKSDTRMIAFGGEHLDTCSKVTMNCEHITLSALKLLTTMF